MNQPIQQAPPQTPQAAPQAQPGQVPVNQNPVDAPAPVGSQAPDRPGAHDSPEAGKGRPQSRREAIQAAFDKANKAASTPNQRAQGQEAKPQAAKKPAAAPEANDDAPLDLKKRPSDQPRGERGQFARRQPELDHQGEIRQGQFDRQAGVRPDGQPAKPVPALPEGAPYRDPPQRMANHAKAEWGNVPESVRGEVDRMHNEFQQAYEHYRGDHEEMNTIRHFHEMARQQGTSLQRAMTNYVGMEQKLRADPIAGLDQIVHNLNLVTSDGHRVTLRDVAYHVLNQTPEQLRMTQQGNMQHAATQQIGALHQEVAGLKSALHQMHTANQFHQTRSAVDVFADDGNHPRFDELADLIEQELRLGFDLSTAYRRAEMLRPATHAAQTRNPSAQTRTEDRSISGSPSATASNAAPGRRRDAKPVGRREAISNAIKRVNGSL